MEGPIDEHLNKLEGHGLGDPNDPKNQNDWKKHIQKALNNIQAELKRLKINKNTFKDVLDKRIPENADKLIKSLKDYGLNVPK